MCKRITKNELMENWRTEELFDIGEWVATKDGFGQIVFNRNLYFEEFEKASGNHKFKQGTFYQTVYVCKILSDFDGSVKKRIKLELYTSVSKLNTKEKKLINKIKKENPVDYKKYLLSEPKENVTRQVFLEYNINDNELELVKQEISKIWSNLPRTFTFKEFKKEGNKSNLPFKISEFIKHNEKTDRSKCVTIRFDSQLYRTKGKESLFDNIRVIKL